MTRQLVYTLGAEIGGVPGHARRKVSPRSASFLHAARYRCEHARTAERRGSVARRAASAALLAGVLRLAYKSPYAPEFMASLSLGGLDGTTRGRFEHARRTTA